jgi:hypothetical protein
MSRTTKTYETGLECWKTTEDGIVTSEHYYRNGLHHRPHEAGPAWIQRNHAGIVTLEVYIWEGKRHRPHEAGPAWIERERNNDGIIMWESYYWEGKHHRPPDAGPAKTRRNDAGLVTCEAYYSEGKRLEGRELGWARRRRLLNLLYAAWTKDGGKPGCSKEGLGRFLALRRVCRFHPDPRLAHRLVEPFGQAVVAFL